MTEKSKNVQQVGSGSIQGKIQMNFHGSVVAVSGNVEGDFVVNSSDQKRNIAEAATEIQQLLNQLEQSYPVNTTSEKMLLAAEVMRQIDSNPTMRQRLFNALKAGGVEALKQVLNNHPVANLLIGALEDWEKQQ